MVFEFAEQFDAKAKMKVVGVGGAGGNAVNRMILEGLTGVDFISVNTDAMALDNNKATIRIQIGERITKGLGAGANPEIGKIAMEEDSDRIEEAIKGADMVFITAGMGGGTGTGGAPIVAEIAHKMDILTVAIVTRPFLFEGKIRDRNAKRGIDELRKYTDTIIVIPNQKLLSIVDRTTSLIDAFKTADHVLHHATKGISDLITVHGLVNLDFADVRTIMKGMGDAIMGSGFAEGENRATTAADSAIHSPMLDDISIVGAKGILINVTGGEDLTLYDVGDATNTIYEAVGQDTETNIIFGAVTDPCMNGKIQVTVIATGFNEESIRKEKEEKAALAASGFGIPKVLVEKKVEQLSFKLEEKKENTVKPKLQVYEKEMQDDVQKAEVIPKKDAKPVCEPITKEAYMDFDIPTHNIEMPKVVNRGVHTDQKYVTRGQVISHYEEDIDVPTFLRKQMQ